jgi:hypothetical protein
MNFWKIFLMELAKKRMNSIPSLKGSTLFRLNNLKPDINAIGLVPEELARKLVIIPLWSDQDTLFIACTDPSDKDLISQLNNLIHSPIKLVKSSFSEIRTAIDIFYRRKTKIKRCLDFEEIVKIFGYPSQDNKGKLKSLLDSSNKTVPEICQEHALINDEHFAEAVGVACSFPFLRVDRLEIKNDFSLLIPWEMATKRKVVPLAWISGMLFVITPYLEPGDHLQDISDMLDIPVQPVICSSSAWDRFFRHFYLRGIPDPNQKDLNVVRWLIENNQVSGLDLDVIQSLALQMEGTLEDALINNDICTRTQWMRTLSEISRVKLASDWKGYRKYLANRPIIDTSFPKSIAYKFSILPLAIEEDKLVIGISNPDTSLVRLVEGFSDMDVQAFLLSPEEIKEGLDILYNQLASDESTPIVSNIGEILQKLGVLTDKQVQTVENQVEKSNTSFEEEIISTGLLDEVDLIEVLSLQTGIPHIDLTHAQFQEKVFTQIPASIAFAHTMIPIWSSDEEIWIVASDPFDAHGLTKVEEITGKRINQILAPQSTISASFELILGKKENSPKKPAVLKLLRKLVESGILTQNSASLALETFIQGQLPLDSAIKNVSDHPGNEIAQAIGKIIDLPYADLNLKDETVSSVDPMGHFYEKKTTYDPIDENAARLISLQDAQRLSAIPIKFEKNNVVVAFADPEYKEILEQLKTIIPQKIIPVYAFREDLENAIQRVLGRKNIGTHLLLDGVISRSQLNCTVSGLMRPLM